MNAVDTEARKPTANRKIAIDFFYLDLNVCGRCKGSNINLDAAVAELSQILAAAGVEVSVTKTQVESEQQAQALRFISSPTIRVNGNDIALEFRESRCESCASVCNSPIDCRVWVFQGQEYTEAPKAMIIDAILREIYAGQPKSAPKTDAFDGVPENVKQFFAGTVAAGCCVAPSRTATQRTCACG